MNCFKISYIIANNYFFWKKLCSIWAQNDIGKRGWSYISAYQMTDRSSLYYWWYWAQRTQKLELKADWLALVLKKFGCHNSRLGKALHCTALRVTERGAFLKCAAFAANSIATFLDTLTNDTSQTHPQNDIFSLSLQPFKFSGPTGLY